MGNKNVEQECLNAILEYKSDDKLLCSLQKDLRKSNVLPSEQPDFICFGDKMIIGLEHFRYDMLCDSKGESLHGKEYSAFNKAQEKNDTEHMEIIQRIIDERLNAIFNFDADASVVNFLRSARSHNNKVEKYRSNIISHSDKKEMAVLAVVDMYCVEIPGLGQNEAKKFLQSFVSSCYRELYNFDGFIICAHDYNGYQNPICVYVPIKP